MGCLLLVLLPVVDAFLLWQLGQRFGVRPTVGMVVVTAIIGVQVARVEGTRVWRQIQQTLREGRSPELAVISTFLVFAGGALLAWPGPASDVAGVLLLLPPTRALVARLLRRRWERAVAAGTLKIQVGGGLGVPRRRPGPGQRPDIIDVEAHPVAGPPAALPPGPPAALPASGDDDGHDKDRA